MDYLNEFISRYGSESVRRTFDYKETPQSGASNPVLSALQRSVDRITKAMMQVGADANTAQATEPGYIDMFGEKTEWVSSIQRPAVPLSFKPDLNNLFNSFISAAYISIKWFDGKSMDKVFRTILRPDDPKKTKAKTEQEEYILNHLSVIGISTVIVITEANMVPLGGIVSTGLEIFKDSFIAEVGGQLVGVSNVNDLNKVIADANSFIERIKNAFKEFKDKKVTPKIKPKYKVTRTNEPDRRRVYRMNYEIKNRFGTPNMASSIWGDQNVIGFLDSHVGGLENTEGISLHGSAGEANIRDAMDITSEGGQIPGPLNRATTATKFTLQAGGGVTDRCLAGESWVKMPGYYSVRYKIYKTDTFPVPGELVTMMVKFMPWRGATWWWQRSNPFCFSGNWVDTTYYTGGFVSELKEKKTDDEEDVYYIVWHGLNRNVDESGNERRCEAKASDYKKYKKGDWVTIAKNWSSYKKSSISVESDSAWSSGWKIVPINMFPGIRKKGG